MERLLARLSDWTARRRALVVAAWLALALASVPFAAQQTDRLTGGGWDVPGSAAVRAADEMEHFPELDGIRFALLVESADPERARAAAELAERRAAELSGLQPFGRPQTFEGGRAILVPLLYVGHDARDGIDFATDLRRAVVSDAGGATTRVIGEPAIWSNFQDVSKEQLAKAEAIGFPLILLILLAAFGTFVAALAPIVLGVAAVVVTGAAVYFLAGAIDVSIYTTNMASMIGIGVAVDYSLFVVSRFRRELRAGREPDEARRAALASAGTAVVFSGVAVVVSLGSLFLIDVTAVRSMAIGAILVVSVAVLATVTLLPALLAFAGRGIDRLRIPFLGGGEAGGRFWITWSERVMRRPLLALALGAAFMLTLALPVLDLRTENHGLAQLPRHSEVRAAMERAAELQGPGAFGPLYVVARDAGAAARIARGLDGLHGVQTVAPPLPSGDGSRHLVQAVLTDDPDSSDAKRTYEQAVALAERERGSGALVGGATAWSIAVGDALVGGLWKIILFVLLCSYVVLMLLLRSVVLPVKAALMNLLSIGAAYGVLVAVFQWGWLDWTGYDSPGYLDTLVPALVLAVTFGLSMDYEVFLLTRIRERYAAGASNERAVAEGLAGSARVITAAALIMVAVFGAFSIAGAPSLKELGVGLGVAIALDATIVRLVIVPATMRLLGDWNWWLPRPLAGILGETRPAPEPS